MIPFNRPTIAPGQIEAVNRVFESRHLAGDGLESRLASEILAGLHGGSPALLTTSCTAALEMCAILLDIEDGDEVIVPSFTFVSTANAFALLGARIVFADSDPATLNISVESVRRLINARTKAIVAVNYGGLAAVTDELVSISESSGAVLIEDNAHGLFGSDGKTPLGTRSALSTLSFHETKNVTCGEGGAIVVNDPQYVERAEIIREKGTDRSRFFRGEIDKYTWVDRGSSYLLSEINAAVLVSQLQFRETIQQRRKDAAATYLAEFESWAHSNGVQIMDRGAHAPHHLFPLLLPNGQSRDRFLAETRSAGVATTFHYLPLHTSRAGRLFGEAPNGCESTDDVSSRLVRVPLFSDITNAEVEQVVATVTGFRT